ncbi:hypothetical protein F5884DRAFT_861749 [Xylogone sp. PMI_703]|nr:hypothetical protein F5884DRAFT_861749 [Xylogone sp. PMI_703]
MPSLWDKAFAGLSSSDKKDLDIFREKSDSSPDAILKLVEDKRDECEKKQWVLYTNRSDEKVLVRDVLKQVPFWLDKATKVGDAAVELSPGYAIIPWMVVKALLQMTIHDCQTFGILLESLETISSIIARYTELETRVLIRTSNLTNQLSAALVKLYDAALKFLAQACRYYGYGTFKRSFKSAIHTKAVIEEPMLQIEKHEDNVYKLVCLVQNECTGLGLEDIINTIKQSVENSRAADEQRCERISAWINGIDTKNTYETSLYYRHSGTCEWAPVSYFFCVADNKLTRDPYAILRSWLTQLLRQDEAILPAMDVVYRTRNKEQMLTHLGLWELFCAVGTAVEGCTFVIDGFDECTDIDTGAGYHQVMAQWLGYSTYKLYGTETLFVASLDDVQYIGVNRANYVSNISDKNLSRTKSRDLVVSRDVPDISEYLGPKPADDSNIQRFEYQITAKDTTADVKSFSEFMVNQKPSKKNEKLRQKIATQAAERSESMFLWIKLLENEISPGQNAKQLTKIVHQMPTGISEAYSRELEKIARLPQDKKAQALMILRWTLFSILHFVHFSVKEYLSNLSTVTPPNNSIANLSLAGAAVEEIRLSRIYLRYLTLNTFADLPPDTNIYPFLSYASWAWYFHGFYQKPKPSQDVMNQTLRAFDPDISSWKVGTPVMEAELTDSSSDDWDFGITSGSDTTSNAQSDHEGIACTCTVQNPIYYASLLGLTDIVQWLEDKGLDCTCAGGNFGFLLQAAMCCKRVGSMVPLLLLPPPSPARSDVVELLAADADVTATDGAGWTALQHYASRRGNAAIVQQLLERGADINASALQSLTAVSIACRFGHKDVLGVLLAHGAKLDTTDTDALHPLQGAILSDDTDVVEILLDNGCLRFLRHYKSLLPTVNTPLLKHFASMARM